MSEEKINVLHPKIDVTFNFARDLLKIQQFTHTEQWAYLLNWGNIT